MEFETNSIVKTSNPLADYLGKAVGAGATNYIAPYEYGGQSANGMLSTYAMGQLADKVSGGADYSSSLMALLGDGIGTASSVATDGSGGPATYYDLGGGGLVSGQGGYGSSAPSAAGSSGGLNPYLTQAQQALTSQITDNLKRNIMPGLSSAAMASGNFGGSRQGVVEANALNDANRQIANGMANLSFNAYESDANRGLQQQSINNSYNLGLGNLALGNTQADNSFYTAQRGQDLQSTALGAQLMNQGNANYLNAGSGVANLGTSQQQAPWQVIGNYTNSISPFTGFGTTTSSQNSNPWASALGGAMGGAQIGKLFG